MPCWYYDKKELRNTPSIRDGMDFETERRYRKEGTRFIMECGTEMILGHHTIATGAIYFHRFYMFHTFQEFPRYVTACCCLFLAGKVEETPKKCRDIITTARSILPDPKFQAFSEDLRKAKEEVMTLESILLQTIKFDLEVEHPYNFLVSYAKSLKGDKSKLQKMVQMAWNFVNDSLSTTVCLQWEPEIIAVALIHLASKLSKFTATDWIGREPTHLRWWDMFISDVTMEILEDICHQVLDLYQQPNQQAQQLAEGSSPPSIKAKTAVAISPIPAQRLKPKDPPTKDMNTENGIHNNLSASEFVKANRSSFATTCSVPPPPPPPLPQPCTGNQPPSIYSMNAYPQSTMMPTNVPYNMPQCAQQPPHNIYYNQPTSRISGAYYPGP
ncbi:cyclin-K-like [Sitodiplosis mosellana]|uniref:cyclin-K-like n=1 Tax=Sitodiplosis mosellana TaxID=263140 RepID=UPI002443CF26|nr:cyclin-K-like [Sitodiplosis mosellana]